MSDMILVVDMVIRLLAFILILLLFLRFYRQYKNKKLINTVTILVHLFILGLFFTNNIDMPYTLFDIMWWSMTGIGIISCLNLIKEKSKLIFILLPTTFIFMIFVVPMMILDKM